MMAAFTWIITFISLAGTVLNVRKNILCFYLWAVGNIAWLAFDVASGLFSRAVLDTVHLAFAIWGGIRMEERRDPPIQVMGGGHHIQPFPATHFVSCFFPEETNGRRKMLILSMASRRLSGFCFGDTFFKNARHWDCLIGSS